MKPNWNRKTSTMPSGDLNTMQSTKSQYELQSQYPYIRNSRNRVTDIPIYYLSFLSLYTVFIFSVTELQSRNKPN